MTFPELFCVSTSSTALSPLFLPVLPIEADHNIQAERLPYEHLSNIPMNNDTISRIIIGRVFWDVKHIQTLINLNS
jgi:hypothetical protein